MEYKTFRVPVQGNYRMYKEMCELHGFPVLDRDCIEEFYVHTLNQIPVYMVGFWTTSSNMTMIGFPVSNKEVSYKVREGRLGKFFSDIIEDVKERGYKVIWTTSSTDRVIDSLVENGFKAGDAKVDTYIKVLS